ncbi:hypothetical protein ACFL47_03590 [Candidatus Latescibacterota bacterium]
MTQPFVFKKYTLKRKNTQFCDDLVGMLRQNGFKITNDSKNPVQLRYPGMIFSSTKPLTCISSLSLDVWEEKGESAVTIGATFTKIKYFTILTMTLLCVVAPLLTSLLKTGKPSLSPISLVGIPLGLALHFNVRKRAFRALDNLVCKNDIT